MNCPESTELSPESFSTAPLPSPNRDILNQTLWSRAQLTKHFKGPQVSLLQPGLRNSGMAHMPTPRGTKEGRPWTGMESERVEHRLVERGTPEWGPGGGEQCPKPVPNFKSFHYSLSYLVCVHLFPVSSWLICSLSSPRKGGWARYLVAKNK
jgi:hypothetical protein